jgi:hypothetical protein
MTSRSRHDESELVAVGVSSIFPFRRRALAISVHLFLIRPPLFAAAAEPRNRGQASRV